MSVKESQMYIVHVPENVKDSNEKLVQASTVPEPFFCLAGTPRMVLQANDRKNNVEFVQTIIPESPSNLMQQDKMCFERLGNVERKEEVLCTVSLHTSLYPHGKPERRSCKRSQKF